MADPDVRDIQFIRALADVRRVRHRRIHRRRRVFRDRADYFEMYNDTDFMQRFQVSKETGTNTLDQIEDQLRHNTNNNRCILPDLLLLICLRFYATGSYHRVAGDLGGISSASVCSIVKRVSAAI